MNGFISDKMSIVKKRTKTKPTVHIGLQKKQKTQCPTSHAKSNTKIIRNSACEQARDEQ